MLVQENDSLTNSFQDLCNKEEDFEMTPDEAFHCHLATRSRRKKEKMVICSMSGSCKHEDSKLALSCVIMESN